MGKFDLKLLKKNSEEMQKQVVDANTKKNYGEGYFKLVADKAKASQALLRFLPYSNDKLPYIKHGSHFFKKDNLWIIAECPAVYSNYKVKCPLCEANKKHYDAANKDMYQQRKAKINYLVNALVIEDKIHPENNGKVLMCELSPAVWRMIQESMSGEFEDPKYPFDVYSGNNFNMVLSYKKDNGFFSYEKSKFVEERTPLAGTDKEIEAILEKTRDLDAIIQQKLDNNGDLNEKAEIAWDTLPTEVANEEIKSTTVARKDLDEDDDLSSVFGSEEEEDHLPF